MIASSLRSGFSLMRSMQMVSQEMPPPISEEFERVINEVNLGRPMEDALRESVSRVKSYDYDLMVTAILINQQVGGNLADILEIIAHTIRERLQIRGEMKALTAEGRISGVILVILPLVLAGLIAVLNPPYLLTLVTEPIGVYLIVTAVLLQIIGGLFIRKIQPLIYRRRAHDPSYSALNICQRWDVCIRTGHEVQPGNNNGTGGAAFFHS
jgi:tight adherence protein B